ncbi:hypothetical protein AGDE_17111 [Angomonas deanei]|nr:hypothetical protein AGDE_17111 [Angomonas deanei]|eukprot:EPY15456.1 hypothetical protein AGDE_17111 [Angomonas deanei]
MGVMLSLSSPERCPLSVGLRRERDGSRREGRFLVWVVSGGAAGRSVGFHSGGRVVKLLQEVSSGSLPKGSTGRLGVGRSRKMWVKVGEEGGLFIVVEKN